MKKKQKIDVLEEYENANPVEQHYFKLTKSRYKSMQTTMKNKMSRYETLADKKTSYYKNLRQNNLIFTRDFLKSKKLDIEASEKIKIYNEKNYKFAESLNEQKNFSDIMLEYKKRNGKLPNVNNIFSLNPLIGTNKEKVIYYQLMQKNYHNEEDLLNDDKYLYYINKLNGLISERLEKAKGNNFKIVENNNKNRVLFLKSNKLDTENQELQNNINDIYQWIQNEEEQQEQKKIQGKNLKCFKSNFRTKGYFNKTLSFEKIVKASPKKTPRFSLNSPPKKKTLKQLLLGIGPRKKIDSSKILTTFKHNNLGSSINNDKFHKLISSFNGSNDSKLLNSYASNGSNNYSNNITDYTNTNINSNCSRKCKVNKVHKTVRYNKHLPTISNTNLNINDDFENANDLGAHENYRTKMINLLREKNYFLNEIYKWDKTQIFTPEFKDIGEYYYDHFDSDNAEKIKKNIAKKWGFKNLYKFSKNITDQIKGIDVEELYKKNIGVIGGVEKIEKNIKNICYLDDKLQKLNLQIIRACSIK